MREDRITDPLGIAAQWHSVMTWHDPGVCMYALSSTGAVQSKEHRQQLFDYIDKDCMVLAEKRLKKERAKKRRNRALIEEYEDDIEDLETLRDYIENAPITPLDRKTA